MRKDLLSARAVATIKEPGRHSDGGNLYLYVSKTGNRSWVFMWSRNGKQREMGFGPVGDVTLAEARDKAREARRHLLAGRDPLVERDRDKQTATFGEFADAYVETMKGQWANFKTAHQWRVMLTTNAAPLRSRPIADVDTEGVLGVLRPMWTKTPEMAVKARSRIEAVLDAAKAKGLRQGENPARWRGHLDQLLPKRPSLVRGHHAAMPY
ncbi:Arm DNA-binding domain-containing protein [Lichenibacterium dinghuense]|uniref:Arm DNA-binding domain-containing protein n=1 Tax=Lichenibacterium dinghuense TaxID=2895977 RepID=UPI001F40166D|nr:Arm DNA-binding domain-containing protein [Lichenibacterium sp. 6Y81]